MKNIKIISFFLGLLLLASCNESEYKDYTAPDELSDVSWVISLNRFAQNPTWINQDTSISFFDLSQGTISHEWAIEQGNNFLKEGFNANTDTLVNFIDESKGISSSDLKAHILFQNSGINKVRLFNKFSSPVTYRASSGVKTSVKEGDLWVIDTTFVFDVYAHLEPAFKVLKNGTEVISIAATDLPDIADESTWPVVEVEAATSLTFEDLTTIGRPNGRSWLAPDGVPSQTGGVTAEIKFYKLGTFNAGTFRSVRFNELPGQTIEKLIPLKVKVIQSSQPFVFDNALTEDESEKISFRVNGEIAPFTGQQSNFTVNVKNTASGFDKDVTVASVGPKDGDATFMELSLTEPIYNSDVITISYNSTGGIKSADDRVLQSFTAQEVQMHFGNNVLPARGHASYEGPNAAANRAFAADYFTGNNNILGGGQFVYERVTSKFFAGDGGIASMKYSTLSSNPVPNVNLWSFGLGKPTAIPAGTYRMSYMIWIDPATTLKTFRTEWNKPAFTRQLWDIENVEKGRWVRIFNTFTTDEITPALNVRFTFRPHIAENAGVTGAQLLWVDDFQLVEIEVRP